MTPTNRFLTIPTNRHNMTATKHLIVRMSQRGITKPMIDIALICGEIVGDKCVANRKAMKRLIVSIDSQFKRLTALRKKIAHFPCVRLVISKIQKLTELRRTAMKVLDKGGITVIFEADALITSYHTSSFKRF